MTLSLILSPCDRWRNGLKKGELVQDVSGSKGVLFPVSKAHRLSTDPLRNEMLGMTCLYIIRMFWHYSTLFSKNSKPTGSDHIFFNEYSQHD